MSFPWIPVGSALFCLIKRFFLLVWCLGLGWGAYGQWPSDPGGFDCRSQGTLQEAAGGRWISRSLLVQWHAGSELLEISGSTHWFSEEGHADQNWNSGAWEGQDSLTFRVEATVPRSIIDALQQGNWVMEQHLPCQVHYRGLLLGSLLKLGEAMAGYRQAPGTVPMMLSLSWFLPENEPVYLWEEVSYKQAWMLEMDRACVNLAP